MSANEDLIDRIYEAAFVPQVWDEVLTKLGNAARSVSGLLLVFEDIRPTGFMATGAARGLLENLLEEFREEGLWRQSQRIQHFRTHPFTGFVVAREYFEFEQSQPAPEPELRARYGFGDQAGTMIAMPSGETVVFAFERRQGDDRFGPGDIVMLNSFYAHLARAGLMAARLGLERAHATVSALNALGLPAAVMSAAGRVLTTNEQFDAMFHTFRPAAYGGMAITDAPANNLFQEAIAAGREDREPLVRSIPLRSIPNRAAAVVHLLPLRRAAQDLFSGAATLLVATEIKPEAHVPHSTLLSALFDLTPAEARLAAALAAGKSLKQTAAEMGISFGSARTYLARIFSKTGTHQQSQLVALLKSAQPMSS